MLLKNKGEDPLFFCLYLRISRINKVEMQILMQYNRMSDYEHSFEKIEVCT